MQDKKLSRFFAWAIHSSVLFALEKSAALTLNYTILHIISRLFPNPGGTFLGQGIGYLAGKTLYFILDSRYSYEIYDHSWSRGIRFIGLEICFAILTSVAYSLITYAYARHSFLIWCAIMGLDSLVEYLLMRQYVFEKLPLLKNANVTPTQAKKSSPPAGR